MTGTEDMNMQITNSGVATEEAILSDAMRMMTTNSSNMPIAARMMNIVLLTCDCSFMTSDLGDRKSFELLFLSDTMRRTDSSRPRLLSLWGIADDAVLAQINS